MLHSHNRSSPEPWGKANERRQVAKMQTNGNRTIFAVAKMKIKAQQAAVQLQVNGGSVVWCRPQVPAGKPKKEITLSNRNEWQHKPPTVVNTGMDNGQPFPQGMQEW